MMIKVNFFDWDGTMVDTKYSLYLAYKDALNETFSFDYFMQNVYNDSSKYMRTLGYSQKEIDKIKATKNDLYVQNFNCELLLEIPKNEINCIVTNTSSNLVKMLLPKIGLKESDFLFIVGSDTDLNYKRKPLPDLYNLAWKKLTNEFKIFPTELIIFEDCWMGLTSAENFINSNNKNTLIELIDVKQLIKM